MQLPLLVFEAYVDKFQQKVAKLQKQGLRPKGLKNRASKAEEYTLPPFGDDDDDSESDTLTSLGIGNFLHKFHEVLPQKDLDKFEFLVEAHYRNVLQFLSPESRYKVAPKISIQGVEQSDEAMSLVDFLAVFFSFSNLAKEIGISPRVFPGLIVNKCKEWFPNEPLTAKLNSLTRVTDEFFLLFTLAHYVLSGGSRRIELNVFKKYQSATDFLVFMNDIANGKYVHLVSSEWKTEKDMFDEELMITTTKKAVRLILPDISDEQSEDFRGFRLIAPSDIQPIELHYEESTQRMLDRLTSILQTCPAEIWDTRRLGVLLAGESGCGKSEYVLQVCRQLGFHCLYLNQISSKWVGETEKAILRILEVEYPRIMKEHDNKVILLIDEIDQILGKKVEVDTSSSFHTNAGVSQMLKSLDRFKGIIVGSLNFLDQTRIEGAGIRRFDMLVNFSLPSRQARKAIWASREGFWQKKEELLERLSTFELSGSDINAICSKGFFLQFAGEAFAEESLLELIDDHQQLASKTRYQKSAGASIGFQKIAS
ncbi:ATP-binding protein [Aquirufa sp.]|jgi:hypothetical protein|uniref:ATP-binding protein n=1 Tax=Aquirufa sp. TaxID=2676249 RepID=UPI0037C1A846